MLGKIMIKNIDKQVLKMYSNIVKNSEKVDNDRVYVRMAKIFRVSPKYIHKIITKNKSKESFKEDEHPRDDDGKFAGKDGGGSVSEYKETTMKDVETKPEVKEIQKKLDTNVTNKVEDAIKELGIEDKIYDVAMQGSYEKGTDLPASGSDMDLFVVFNTNVSEEEKNQYGLEIGRKVLNKDFAESQGWTD